MPEASQSATGHAGAAARSGGPGIRSLSAAIGGLVLSSVLLLACGTSSNTHGQDVRHVTVPAALLAGDVGDPRCDDVQHFCIVRTQGSEFIALYAYDTNAKFRARGCVLTWEPDRRFVDQAGAAGVGAFHSPCSDAVFDRTGRVAFGTAPRDMDRFPLKKAVTGETWIDVSQLICGDAQSGAAQSCDLAPALAVAQATSAPGQTTSDITPISTWTATAPATATAAGSTPTPAAAATAAAPGGAGVATTLTLVAKNTLFDKSELQAKPGAVTIDMDNQDAGIPHNIHVYQGNDNTGKDMGKTEFEPGPVKQTLTLNLTAGEYYFVCEVHPATMAGKLVVR